MWSRLCNRMMYVLLMVSAVWLSGCQEKALFDERGDDLEDYDYYIDADGNEGIVIEAYSSYVVVMSIDEATCTWGPVDDVVVEDADEDVFETDKFSTVVQYAMLDRGVELYPAQAWCCAKNKQGQKGLNSWRLPSLDDWEDMIRSDYRLERLNEALIKMGGTPLHADKMYWTCTEDYESAFVQAATKDYDPANRAVCINPAIKAYTVRDRWVKNNPYQVRAIKHVYYK